MKWFKEKFLTSFDERLDEHINGIWISEKQTDICLRYMKPSKNYGSRYYIVIGDYQYTLNVMKKGYGRLIKADKRVAYH